MTTMRSTFNWLMAITVLVGAVLSLPTDVKSNDHAPSASKSQQQQAQQSQKQQQQSSTALSSNSLPDTDSISMYSPYLTAEDESDALLVPYNDFFGEEFDGEMGDVELESGDLQEMGEDSVEAEKRYRPRFVGKRYAPRFVGKRFNPRFVGKRYAPRFVGKRYAPRFVGKRYAPRFVGKRQAPRFIGKRQAPRFIGKRQAPRFIGKRQAPRFIGKRQAPRFIGKRAAEETDDNLVIHSIHKRQAPRFIGKRESVYEPLGVASWELGEYDNDFNNGDDEFYEEEEEDNSGQSKGCADNGEVKRGAPRFIGKRGPPRFVGKRYHPRFVGRRGAPRFVGKRGHPRFVGKRSEDELNAYLLQLELLNNIYDQKRAAPRFVGKKSVFGDFSKSRLEEKDVQTFLDDWSRQEAIKNLVANDKKWSSPVTPSFIGKRADSDDFKR